MCDGDTHHVRNSERVIYLFTGKEDSASETQSSCRGSLDVNSIANKAMFAARQVCSFDVLGPTEGLHRFYKAVCLDNKGQTL